MSLNTAEIKSVIKEWNKVDGSLIAIYDEDTDSIITIGPGYKGMGSTFYILTTSVHLMNRLGLVTKYVSTMREYLTDEQVEERSIVLMGSDNHSYSNDLPKIGLTVYAQGYQKDN